jgi:dihydrofolate reductase
VRKLVVHTLASLDGVVDDPQAWGGAAYRDDEGVRDYLGEALAAHAMVMGRHGYDTLQRAFGSRPDPWATRINAMPKYVFSSTLRDPTWPNTTIVRGDARGAVEELVRGDGGDLLIYGYTRFADALLRDGLVDVLRVDVHPVLVGRGRTLWREGVASKLALAGVKTYTRGVVMLAYGKP